MLYKKKMAPYEETDFQDPSAEYRGAPFWAWNCKIDPEDITGMTEMFAAMGMGGAHLHSRTGMDMPYLGEKFMESVKLTCEKTKEKDMLVWLYDEDRWPSGFAGGYVTAEKKYRARVLLMSPERLEDAEENMSEGMSAEGKYAKSNKILLGIYSITQDKDGWMTDYKRLTPAQVKEEKPEMVWYAYLKILGESSWFNGQTYVNVLDPEAIRKFIEVTHEKYYEEVGKEFGGLIPAIFTDEPQCAVNHNRVLAKERKSFFVPFTDDFPESYSKAYGEDFLEKLPEVFFDKKDEYSVMRYRYHDHLTERFVSAYSDQIGTWCEEHGIAMTGHVMDEPTLKTQTKRVGEAMRFYRSMQLPGIDMLAWRIEYNTAKQCQSVVHQYGREGMLSELYGVTNWDFDFRGHKSLGDWQAALGVTVRVPHLSWTSMEGEAKRDYPASIGYQSPWYQEYKLVEDYFARVNTILTRGKCVVKLGVLHPIESYWLCYGSDEKTGELRNELDEDFDMLTRWLLGNAKDFDLIAESLIHELYSGSSEGMVRIGKMEYSTLLVPNMLTMRSETLAMLQEFKNAGGRVIFTGYLPEYVDGMKNPKVKEFAGECEYIPFQKNQLLQAVKDVSDIELLEAEGVPTDNLLIQLRQDGDERWLFVAHKPAEGLDQILGTDAYTSRRPRVIRSKRDRTDVQNIVIKIKGIWSVRVYDAWTGKVSDAEVMYENGYTHLPRKIYGQDSLLLRMIPEVKETVKKECENSEWKELRYEHFSDVTLSEPNVFLLDMAEYAFDNGEWQEREEILRIDNLFRDKLGLKYRMEGVVQPWVLKEESVKQHELHLRFRILSETEIENAELALEHPQDCHILWNGKEVSNEPVGRYVDRDIHRIQLGEIHKGENLLEVSIPFGEKTNVEAMYLLGDFGVRAHGDMAEIMKPVKKIHFGSWTMEGLPFYGGNVTYHIPIEGNGRALKVALNKFRSPVIAVSVDGKRQGMIAISPYEVITESLEKGKHMLDITVYGNRFNTFGALHNTDEGKDVYCDPDFWRSEGQLWSYEYQLRETGPLMAPRIYELV